MTPLFIATLTVSLVFYSFVTSPVAAAAADNEQRFASLQDAEEPMSEQENAAWLNQARLKLLSKRFHATQGMRYMDPDTMKTLLGMNYDKRAAK